MRYRLRTLLMLLAVGPIILALIWFWPAWLPLAIEPGLFMLAGALAMALLVILLNASESIAATVFRFRVRDMVWLALVLVLLCVLWENNRNLVAARIHAYNLRLTLRHLRHYYHPDKPP